MVKYKIYKILRFFRLISKKKYKKLMLIYTKEYWSISKSRYFDKVWYTQTYNISKLKRKDPINHYLKIGWKKGYNPSANFDNDFYLTNNPDILLAELNPLFHYETFGKYENRQIAEVSDNFAINYSSVNGDVLLFSHELSLTGAPIALLNMAKIIKSNGLNPIIFSPKHGDLELELKTNGIDYIIEPYLLVKLYRQDKKLKAFLSSFEIILFNTIDTLKYAQYINTKNKKLCWVHEGEFGYECANSAFDIKNAFKNIDTVYSVGEYSKSFTDKYIPQEKSNILLYGIENIQDIPEISENQKLTFGIFGVCCERKGTDLFVQAINKLPKRIKNECCFKVIGRIDNDNFCDNLKKISKNIDIIYTGQLSHDDTLKEMAQIDVIVCPSLDDPMPIVCTEAMQLNKPVICSDHTGTASFIEDGVNGFIYRLGQDNLENIITAVYDNRNNLKNIGQKWHEIYIKHFTKEVFDKNIMNILYPERKNHTIQECFELLSNIYEKLQKVV